MPRARILCGGWEGHEPEATSARFARLLRAAGWDVEIARDLDGLHEAGLRGLALLVPNWTLGSLDDAREAALAAAVEGGMGLAGWHGGMGDAFRDRPGFQFVAGGQFVAHPGGVRRYAVAFPKPDHPLTAGLDGFEIESEQYYLHVDPGVEVLAETVLGAEPMPWLEGVRMPVAWTRHHGRGRVFYCALGHGDADFDIPEARELVLRGLLWAGRAR